MVYLTPTHSASTFTLDFCAEFVALFMRFFSYPVLVQDSHRTGTQNVYAAKWDKWLVWYSHFRVDPLRQGLASSTIRGYYSAITTTLKQLGGGRVRSSHSRPSLIRDVLRGFSLGEARSPRRSPSGICFSWCSHSTPSPWFFLPRADVAARYTLSAVWIKILH